MSCPSEVANYLKIAGTSIFAFDYFQTLPAEIRFYKRQKSITRLSIACWLLIAVRYLGMAAIVLSMIGCFSTSLTLESCAHFFVVVPVVKVLAAVASQGVFIFRTYAICQRNRKILYFLLVFGGILSVAEIVSPIVVSRTPRLGPSGHCLSNLSKDLTSWIQYLCQVVFDLVILAITINRLFRGSDRKFGRSEFTRIFWKSQVMYFVAVTIMNILNLIFFSKFGKSSASTTFSTLGIAITAIFSSRVILDLHDASHRPGTYSTSGVTAPQQNANGTHTITYRNGEIVDRQFRVMAAEETKTEAYRMEGLDMPYGGGIRIQREVVEMVDSDRSPRNSWERRQPGSDVKGEAI